MISLSAAFFAGGGDGNSPLFDIFGFAAPLSGVTDIPITEVLILGPPVSGTEIEVDAIAGVTDKGFLLSRLFWICVSGVLVFLSGFVFKSSTMKWVQPKAQSSLGPAVFSQERIIPSAHTSDGPLSQLLSEWRQLLRPRWFVALLLATAIAGAVFPFRGMVGPAIALLLIFPLTQHGARWRGREMSGLTDLAPNSAISQILNRNFACIAMSLALCLPSLCRMFLTGNLGEMMDMAAIGIGLPVLAISLGHFTRGPVAGRLILLILWYIYLNMGPSPLG